MWEFKYQHELPKGDKVYYKQKGFERSLDDLIRLFEDLYQYEQRQEDKVNIQFRYTHSETGELLSVKPYSLFSEDGRKQFLQELRKFDTEDYKAMDLYYYPENCPRYPLRQFLVYDILALFDSYVEQCISVKWIPLWDKKYFVYVPMKNRGSIVPHRREIVLITKFLHEFRNFVLANIHSVFVF